MKDINKQLALDKLPPLEADNVTIFLWSVIKHLPEGKLLSGSVMQYSESYKPPQAADIDKTSDLVKEIELKLTLRIHNG